MTGIKRRLGSLLGPQGIPGPQGEPGEQGPKGEQGDGADTTEPMLLQLAATSKGGVIGVGDRGVIAFRFDDWHEDFHNNVYPLFLERGLPGGFATISRLSEQSWSRNISPAQIKEWNSRGIEIHSHGVDHKDPSPFGDAGIYDQIVNSKAEIEAWGVKVQGWMQPGATPLTDEVPYGFSSPPQFSDLYTTYAWNLIRQTYPISEAYLGGHVRDLPFAQKHGVDHITISDGMSLESAFNMLNYARRSKSGIEFMIHSGNLGRSGMTLSELTQLLDHVVVLWNAGEIEVLTPSGLQFADHSSTRVNLIDDGSFEAAINNDNSSTPWNIRWNSGMTIEEGGRNGGKFLRIPETTSSLATQSSLYMQSRGFGGETFLFEGWARRSGDQNTVPRVRLIDIDDENQFSLNLTSPQVGTEWTRIRHAFSLHPEMDRVRLELSRNWGGGIDWDDISVLKV